MKNVYVAAAVIEKDGKFFATQRGYGEFKDRWEFPGGKIEPGETPEAALLREIREELGIGVRIRRKIARIECDYPSFHLSMETFLVTAASGQPHLTEHEASRWLSISELGTVDFLPADRLAAEKLREMYS